MFRNLAGLLALFSAPLLFAQPKWITLKNENFQMYSSANQRDSLAALNYFERVRGFFIQMTGAPPAKPVPIYVVMFGSEKEYLPYRPNEFAAAYYSGQSDRDFIVMGKTGEQTAHAATHEYTHLVVRHSGYNLPPWLNEGLAELFSTMHPLGGDTIFGDPIVGRLQALYRESWVPLETIVKADHASPYYNEKNQAGSLYNQSWALVHMLATTKEYGSKFWDVVGAVQNGADSIAALERAYGMPFARIEAALKLYIRGNSFNSFVAKIRLENIDKLKAEPADMFDVRTLQADLLMGRAGKEAEARMRYEELTREDGKRPEPWSGLGYLAWRAGNTREAVANFGKAYELGSRKPRLLWDYARLAAREHPEDAVNAIGELLEIEPKNTEARIELAGLQMNLRRYGDAVATARAVTSVKTAAERDRLLLIRASGSLQLGEQAEAKARAEELKRLSKEEFYTSRAEEILRFLEMSTQRVAQGAMAPVARPERPAIQEQAEIVETPQRPALQERETQPATRADLEIIVQDVRGRLVELDCRQPAVMVLETEQGRRRYGVLQPDRLIVTGRVGGAEFKCGAQTPAAELRLQFTIAPEGSDLYGVVRAVHF